MMTFYCISIIIATAFFGSVKSACTEGTSTGCLPSEICHNGNCYPNIGPCIGGGCLPGATCVNGLCLNTSIPITTTTLSTTRTTATTTPPCVDRHAPGRPSDCPQNAYLCNNAIYYGLMTQQCPRTCNRCPGTNYTTPSSSCFNRVGPDGTSNCDSVGYLCRVPLYADLMRQQCPKTCGYC